jgi:LysR family transcriptional regulator, regulator for metE and metH
VQAARTALAALRAAARDLERARGGPRRTLRLSSQCSTNYKWLAPIAQRHRELHPELDLRFVTTLGDEPLPALRQGLVDVALVTKTKATADGVHLRPLFEDELVAVVGRHHPWAQLGTVDAARLAAAHFVLYEVYDPQRAEPVPLPLPGGIVPARLTTAPMITQMLVELVATDDLVTVMSRWVAATYVEAGDVAAVRMTTTPPVAAWFVATRSGEQDTAVIGFAEQLARQAHSAFTLAANSVG